MTAYRDYSRQAPVWRAVAVCLLFSMPALVISILLEMIPLQDPHDGVKANYGAWIRNFFIVFFNTLGVLVQITQLVPKLSLSIAQILALSVASTSCYMLMMISMASFWVYPVPFGLVISIIPGGIFVVFFFLLTTGLRRFQSDAGLRQAMFRQISILTAQVVLAVIYPIFIAIYHRLAPTRRIFFVVLLPIIKILMQQFIAWSAKDLEDFKPGIVVFCVDVLNALYASKSMQSASESTRLTAFFIIAFDTLELIFVLNKLRHQVLYIGQIREQDDQAFSGQSLLEIAVELSKNPAVLSNNLIHIHSSIKYSPIEPEARGPKSPGFLLARPASVKPTGCSPRSAQIVPLDSATSSSYALPRTPNQLSKVQFRELTRSRNQELLQSILKLLFDCEYHLLVKYVECFVPLMYAIYVAAVQQLPSAQYYPETRGLSASHSQTIVLNIILFAALETLLFLLLHTVVKRRCGVPPTHLLAFVLENQVLEFQ